MGADDGRFPLRFWGEFTLFLFNISCKSVWLKTPVRPGDSLDDADRGRRVRFPDLVLPEGMIKDVPRNLALLLRWTLLFKTWSSYSLFRFIRSPR